MMNYIQRRPEFNIRVIRPVYGSAASQEDVVFEYASDSSNPYLISYQYTQDLASFESPFSLVFVNKEVERGKTVFDYFLPLDLVQIEEFGEVKYLGVVSSCRSVARMSEGGPDRSIVVSGYGIGGIISRFTLLLDQVILSESKTTIDYLNTQVKTLINNLCGSHKENVSLASIMRTIKTSFQQAMEKIGGYPAGTGIFKVVDAYLAFSAEAERLYTKYPLALSIFSYGDGANLADIWQSLVYRPLYEFFIRWDEVQKKYLLNLRPTPFDPAAWLALRMTKIEPVTVPSCDLGISDEEVKSWYFAYLAGGAMSYEEVRAIYQKEAIQKDTGKWALYGYRPLEVQFKYADSGALAKTNGSVTLLPSAAAGDVLPDGGAVSDKKLMATYSKRMKAWFENNDKMLTGTIETMTMKGGPRIGERAEFHNAQFYVESVTGQWSYGGQMLSVLKVTRGGIYNANWKKEGDWWFKKATNVGGMIGRPDRAQEFGYLALNR